MTGTGDARGEDGPDDGEDANVTSREDTDGSDSARRSRSEPLPSEPLRPKPLRSQPVPLAEVLVRRNALLDAVIDCESRIAQLHAEQAEVLAALAANPIPLPTRAEALEKQWLREEISCALRIREHDAAERIATATDLVHDLPGMHALLTDGAVSYAHAAILSRRLIGHDLATKRQIEDLVLPLAPDQTADSFGRAVRTALLTVAPKPSEQRHREALAQRRLVLTHGENGMSELWASLPSAELARLMATVRTLARALKQDNPDDARTPEQRRADAFLALANGPDGKPAPININVSVALSTLLGLDDQPGDLAGAGVHGINPISATQARLIALDPANTWRRLVTDPLGRLIDYGRTKYRPPKSLADHVIARDRTSRFPNSPIAAASCDLDHRLGWADGGQTNETNLAALAPRAHHAKHEAGWKLRRDSDGTHHWTSPLGKDYTVPAATYPIDNTATITNGPPARKLSLRELMVSPTPIPEEADLPPF